MLAILAAITFAIEPPQPLMCERVHVRIRGLPPNETLAVHAAQKARDGGWWRSYGSFVSSVDGFIDLAQKPVAGTYSQADAMGLFRSMRPDGNSEFFDAGDPSLPLQTQIRVLRGKKVLATATVVRRFAAPGVRKTALREGGMVAKLYEPERRRVRACAIVLGGSEGGFDEPDAAMLASAGVTALALGYFGAEGLPGTLQNIRMEYFGAAVRWMRAKRGCEAVALWGASRGTEAALFAASLYAEVAGVVAQSPSHVLWEGLTEKTMPGGPAWTLGGKPLPYAPNRIGFAFALRYLWGRAAGSPVPLTPMFLDNLRDRAAAAAAEIPVERIRGPVLVLAGTDDQKWPSELAARRILGRRKEGPRRDEFALYEGAGHWIPTCYLPIAGPWKRLTFAIGGTAEGTAKAQADAWPRIVRFLAAL